jgi:hypothetical protein
MSNCAIWQTPCEDLGTSGTLSSYDSPRAGGRYRLSVFAKSAVEQLTPDQKRAVTNWIVSQHRAGVTIPILEKDNIHEIKNNRRMNFSERLDRALTRIMREG